MIGLLEQKLTKINKKSRRHYQAIIKTTKKLREHLISFKCSRSVTTNVTASSEILFIRKLQPNLDVQTDSVRVKVLV